MIRAYNTTTKQYHPFKDYIASFNATSDYGDPRTISAIVTHTDGNIKCTSTAHELLSGQTVIITGTTNYDGEYLVGSVIDADTFTLVCDYIADESSAVVYPDMSDEYYIVFLIGVEEVFTNVKRKTAYIGKSAMTKDGQSLLDNVAMTEDDETLFLDYLRVAGIEVSNKLKANMKDILNAYKFNSNIDLDADGTGDGTYYLHYAVNPYTGQDLNAYAPVERVIYMTLENYVIAEWFSFIGLSDQYRKFAMQYMENLQDVKSKIMQSEGRKRIQFRNMY